MKESIRSQARKVAHSKMKQPRQREEAILKQIDALKDHVQVISARLTRLEAYVLVTSKSTHTSKHSSSNVSEEIFKKVCKDFEISGAPAIR